MLHNKKAVLFDLDGTLIDSMWMWKEIDLEYLGRHNCILPENLQQDIEGMSFTQTAIYFKERFDIHDSIEVMQAEWNAMAMEKYKSKAPLKEGALAFITYLKDQGIGMGIGTSNSKELLEVILDTHHIRDYFDAVHTSCEVSSGKPEPQIYLLVAQHLGIAPEECLVFEDIPMGILAGNRAGMETCAVWDRYSIDQEEEKRHLADYYIHNYYDVLKGTYEVLKA